MSKAENFRNFLVQHAAFEKYCINIKNQRRSTFKNAVNHRLSFNSIIDETLSWASTPEGRNYWSNLNALWNSSLKEGKKFKPEYKSIW